MFQYDRKRTFVVSLSLKFDQAVVTSDNQPFGVAYAFVGELITGNKPFLSCILHLFQNESWCRSFHTEMDLVYKKVNVQERLYTETRFETEVRASWNGCFKSKP